VSAITTRITGVIVFQKMPQNCENLGKFNPLQYHNLPEKE
jgi:hypothetical protein